MTSRLFIRASEVPTLYGENKKQSEWALWNDMIKNVERPLDEFGLWKSRLQIPIMTGICEDHKLAITDVLSSANAASLTGIMPPKAWSLKATTRTENEPAVLVIDQRSTPSLREWRIPDKMPPKALRRLKAIAVAYNVQRVMLGLLIDGYSSQLYSISVSDEEAAEMKERVAAFVERVKNQDEPDLDFDLDEKAIRSGTGINVTKINASNDAVENLIAERSGLQAENIPLEARVKAISTRIRAIDTMLIGIAGETNKIETSSHIVTLTRNAAGACSVVVTNKAVDLF